MDEVIHIVRSILQDSGIGHRVNKNNTITVFHWLGGTVAATLRIGIMPGNPLVVTAFRSSDTKIHNLVGTYDLHSTRDFEDLRAMLLQVSHRPVTAPVTEEPVTSYYLECHIVVRPPSILLPESDTMMQDIGADMQKLGFWMSTLSMDESQEEQEGDLIFTTREPASDLTKMQETMKTALDALGKHGARVTRYKVEAAVMDSKKDDSFFKLAPN